MRERGNRELLFSVTKKDLVIETFRAGGKGGQAQNKTDSGVRIKHPASGAVGESREHRSQHQNKMEALKRLAAHPKFKLWQNQVVYTILNGKTVEEVVDEQMDAKNLKVEIKDGKGRWVAETATESGD